jgi:hypothetical protein
MYSQGFPLVLRRIALDRAIILLLFAFNGLRPSDSRKQRSWVGPTNFFEGTIPPKRSGLGLVEIEEKIYIFGGYSDGEKQQFYRFSFFVWPLIRNYIQRNIF